MTGTGAESTPLHATALAALEREIEVETGRPCRVRPWRQGVQFAVLAAVVGGRRCVLRVPVSETSFDQDGEVDFADLIAREAVLHSVLAGAGIPVPALIAWRRRGHTAGHSWMLMEHVDHDGVTTLDAAQQSALGRLARQVHGIEVAADAFVGPGGAGSGEALLARTLARYRFAASTLTLPRVEEIEPVLHWAFLAAGPWSRPAIVHMDLRPPNLCFKGNRLVAVLDMTNGMIASALAELGRMEAYGLLTPSFLDGYGVALDDADRLRIRAHSVDTLAMLVAVVAVGITGDGALSGVGSRLQGAVADLARRATPDVALL